MKKRIISWVLVIAFFEGMFFPSFAAEADYTSSMTTFWDSILYQWAVEQNGDFILGNFPQDLASFVSGEVCSQSEDLLHHTSSVSNEFEKDSKGSYTWATCKYCQERFKVYASDLKNNYNSKVTTMPINGVTSAGKLLWQPTKKDVSGDFVLDGGTKISPSSLPRSNESGSYLFSFFNHFTLYLFNGQGNYSNSLYIRFSFVVPISGVYCLQSSIFVTGSYQLQSSISSYNLQKNYSGGKIWSFSSGEIVSLSPDDILPSGKYLFRELYIYFPVFEITPYDDVKAEVFAQYPTISRPTAITGGNYGIVGDNGQITKVENNSTIVNETNNTYYNPSTGQTTPITEWSYNYEDRSYNVTTESGDTVTITYGDENISIIENNTVEGDTITNNYTIYYITNNNGGGTTDPDDPESGSTSTPTCTHEWGKATTIEPTCTIPGSVSATCTKCGEAKKETLPALGHDWQVKQTVKTEYDDTGQLVQQGYTIFECARCQEQRKSDDGTVPPGGGSGTDPGGDDGKETIWQKLGKLIGAIGSGALGLIDAALGKLLDALISLVEMLSEKLATVVETILSLFDELPKIFGGFLDFLTAVFPFLPPEIMLLLTFGIVAVITIGIIKALRR